MRTVKLDRLLKKSRILKSSLLEQLRGYNAQEVYMALSGICYELGTHKFRDEDQADEYSESFELMGSRMVNHLLENDDAEMIPVQTDLDVLLVVSGILTEVAAASIV